VLCSELIGRLAHVIGRFRAHATPNRPEGYAPPERRLSGASRQPTLQLLLPPRSRGGTTARCVSQRFHPRQKNVDNTSPDALIAGALCVQRLQADRDDVEEGRLDPGGRWPAERGRRSDCPRWGAVARLFVDATTAVVRRVECIYPAWIGELPVAVTALTIGNCCFRSRGCRR